MGKTDYAPRKRSSPQDISPLIEAIEEKNFEEFNRWVASFDLDRKYEHEEFSEPQLLSQFLFLRLLGFIDGGECYPEVFIQAVLAKKPKASFSVEEGYPFTDFIHERREVLIEAISDLKGSSDLERGATPISVLLGRYERELVQIELIDNYLNSVGFEK